MQKLNLSKTQITDIVMITQLMKILIPNHLSAFSVKLLGLLNGGKLTLFHKKLLIEELPMKKETSTSDTSTKLTTLMIKNLSYSSNLQVSTKIVNSLIY